LLRAHREGAPSANRRHCADVRPPDNDFQGKEGKRNRTRSDKAEQNAVNLHCFILRDFTFALRDASAKDEPPQGEGKIVTKDSDAGLLKQALERRRCSAPP